MLEKLCSGGFKTAPSGGHICFIRRSSQTQSSFSRIMLYAVDIQGFKQPLAGCKKHSNNPQDDYVVKELAINPLLGDKDPIVVLFKPPYSWERFSSKYRNENKWLEQYYHGLPWNSGTMPYIYIGPFLREHLADSTKVYVMGTIQKRWLERFKFNVMDIAEMGHPPLDKVKKLVTVCPHHNGSYRANCALHNVKLMKQYLHEYSIPLEAMDYI